MSQSTTVVDGFQVPDLTKLPPPIPRGTIGTSRQVFLERLAADVRRGQSAQTLLSGICIAFGIVLISGLVLIAPFERSGLDPLKVVGSMVSGVISIAAGYPMRDRYRRIERLRVICCVLGMCQVLSKKGGTKAQLKYATDRFDKCFDETGKP